MDDPGLLLDIYDYLTADYFEPDATVEQMDAAKSLSERVRAELVRLLANAALP